MVNRVESKVTVKARSKSKQSIKSINAKKMTPSSNKSKSKIVQNRSQNKIKPFKPENTILKQEHSIKIPRKKKKQ